MKKSLVIILAGIVFATLIAAGCTNSPGLTPATPAATTAVTTPSLQVTTATPAPQSLSWSGVWNTTWLGSDGNLTLSSISMTQAGSVVSGMYHYTIPGEGVYNGTLTAAVHGNKIAGNYSESDNDTGVFEFELSADQNSFTGRWAHASAGEGALNNSTLFWNGIRK